MQFAEVWREIPFVKISAEDIKFLQQVVDELRMVLGVPGNYREAMTKEALLHAERNSAIYRLVALFVAVSSIAIGVLYLTGFAIT